MAADTGAPSVSFSAPIVRGRAKKFYYFGEESLRSWVPEAINKAYRSLDLNHEMLASNESDPTRVEELLREDGVGGGIFTLEMGVPWAAETEYVTDMDDLSSSFNVAKQDDFSDLHVENTYITVLTTQIKDFIANRKPARALIIGSSTPIYWTAVGVLDELEVPCLSWDPTGSINIDSSVYDYSAINIIISALPNDVEFPALPDQAFRPDVLFIDNKLSETESAVVSRAKAANSAVITGLELFFESLILATHMLITPIGRDTTLVGASTEVLEKAFMDRFGANFRKAWSGRKLLCNC